MPATYKKVLKHWKWLFLFLVENTLFAAAQLFFVLKRFRLLKLLLVKQERGLQLPAGGQLGKSSVGEAQKDKLSDDVRNTHTNDIKTTNKNFRNADKGLMY